MPLPPPPDPRDPPERLYAQARLLHAALAEKEAVLARVRAHIGLWTGDKRLRIAGEILLRDLARIEEEEAQRTRSEGR